MLVIAGRGPLTGMSLIRCPLGIRCCRRTPQRSLLKPSRSCAQLPLLSGLGSEGGVFVWAESLGSSRIEGVSPSTRRVVHALIRRQHFPDRQFHDSVVGVVGNIDAHDTASAMLADRSQLRLQSLLEAHCVLIELSPTPHLGGVVWKDQNWIGGNDRHPLEGESVGGARDASNRRRSTLRPRRSAFLVQSSEKRSVKSLQNGV